MKKTYIQPTIDSQIINLAQMIAGSCGVGLGEGDAIVGGLGDDGLTDDRQDWGDLW